MSAFTPDGMSTATTCASDEFMALTNPRASLGISPRSPVPYDVHDHVCVYRIERFLAVFIEVPLRAG